MDVLLPGGVTVPCVVIRKPIKNMYLRLKPDGSIVVTANKSVSQLQIDRFIAKHAHRIAKARAAVVTKEAVPEGMMRLWGKLVPRPAAWTEADYRRAIVEAAKACAQTLPPSLFSMPVAYRARLMKTRFGSCAVKTGKVTLNAVLARYDRRFLEAILAHELVHFAHPDHGKGFYDTLLQIVPDYRRLRKELGELFRRTEV